MLNAVIPLQPLCLQGESGVATKLFLVDDFSHKQKNSGEICGDSWDNQLLRQYSWYKLLLPMPEGQLTLLCCSPAAWGVCNDRCYQTAENCVYALQLQRQYLLLANIAKLRSWLDQSPGLVPCLYQKWLSLSQTPQATYYGQDPNPLTNWLLQEFFCTRYSFDELSRVIGDYYDTRNLPSTSLDSLSLNCRRLLLTPDFDWTRLITGYWSQSLQYQDTVRELTNWLMGDTLAGDLQLTQGEPELLISTNRVTDWPTYGLLSLLHRLGPDEPVLRLQFTTDHCRLVSCEHYSLGGQAAVYPLSSEIRDELWLWANQYYKNMTLTWSVSELLLCASQLDIIKTGLEDVFIIFKSNERPIMYDYYFLPAIIAGTPII